MNRVFMIVSSPCFGPTGGGHGIAYRLYESNKEYNLIENLYFIFSDRVIEPGKDVGELAKKIPIQKHGKLYNYLKKYKPSFLRVKRIKNEYSGLKEYMKKLNEMYRFDKDDVYIFQDIKSAYAFSKLYDYKKCASVFHMQGSMYNEWKATLGIESEPVHRYFNEIFLDTISKMEFLCFPSKGTEESLINTEPLVKDKVMKVNRKYLYNGILCPNISEHSSWVKEIKDSGCLVFSTVAVLNEAKAVEQIPQYLGRLKQRGIKFVWVLIGNGVNKPFVEKEIEKAEIKDNVIWRMDFVHHDEVLDLLSITDFYILFHKQSIFDLSTLEAMHYGAIPVLTPVGGNKEVIIDHNGIFVDDFNNVDELMDIIMEDKLLVLKKKNVFIQEQFFNDLAMLKRYVELITELQ